jgi:hypothetical protein
MHGPFITIQSAYCNIYSILYCDQGRQPSASYCKFNTKLTGVATHFGLSSECYDRGLYSVINDDIQQIFLRVILKE